MHGFTVAVVGPDGAGKTTVVGRLAETLPMPCRRMYMSINPASGNHMLLTTRLSWMLRGRPEHIEAARWKHTNRLIRLAANAAEMANRVAEESYRLLIAYLHVRLGRVVLFDRHYFFDYYASDIAAENIWWMDRFHGFLLKHFPSPDLVVYLDAPPELLLQRKGEGTAESLTAMRYGIREAVRGHPRRETIDGTLSIDEVVRRAAKVISDFALTRRTGGQGLRAAGATT